MTTDYTVHPSHDLFGEGDENKTSSDLLRRMIYEDGMVLCKKCYEYDWRLESPCSPEGEDND